MEYVKLGSVARVVSGHPFKSSDMSNKGLPIIKIKNIQPPLVNVSDTDRVCTMAIDKRAERFKLCKGDVLIAMTGATVGKIGRVPLLKEPTYLNQRVGKLFLTDPIRADYDYLYYVLSRDVTIQEIFSTADGSAQANVSGSQIESMVIPLPPLETQKEIAHILGTLDDKIELNRKMNKTLEEIAQTLYRHWFIDFEFPNADGKPYKSSGGEMIDSELGPIPKGWRVGKLGDLCSVEKRLIDPRKQNIDQYKLFSIQAYDDGQTARYVASSEIHSSKLHVPDSCILISKLNPLIKRIWHVNDKSSDKICSTEFLVITSAHSLPYLMCLLDSEQVYSVIEGSTTGTSGSHQRVTAFHVLSIKVIIPNIESEAFFHSITEESFSMISSIDSLNVKLSKARHVYQEALFDVYREHLTGT